MTAATAYRLRQRAGGESFAVAWDKLLREARGRAMDMAMEQALTQSFVPRTYRGLFVGTATANNERMILAALRASGFGERMPARAEPGAVIARFLSG